MTIDKAMTPMQERMIQERLGALADILKDIGYKFDLAWADSDGNIWHFNIMTEAEKDDMICITRQEFEKQRRWKFHECDNCKYMYHETAPTVCDCANDATSFTEHEFYDINKLLERYDPKPTIRD